MIKFIKKLAYWGTGIFFCAILVSLVLESNNYISFPFSSHRHQKLNKNLIKGELYLLYEACKSYWAKTNRTNTCNADIASLTSYGYYKSTSVSIWGESGDESNYTAYGTLYDDIVIKLEGIRATKPSELIFRELENEELESALAKLNKQTDPEKAQLKK